MSFTSAKHPAQSKGTLKACDVHEALHVDETENKRTYTWQVPQPASLTVVITIDQCPDQWDVRVAITNDSDDLKVHDLKIAGLQLPCKDAALLFPQGAGRRVTDFAQMPDIKESYPSHCCSMPWLMVDRDADQGGVYVGVHDPQDQCVDIAIATDEQAQNLQVSFTRFPFVAPGQTVTLPPVVIKAYDGHWSTAAKFYRNWFDSVGKVASIPTWMRENSGWLLAILKQQNESVNYDYITGIDELADIAIARGLSTLGLFGWTVGGHDHLYPDYDPCPKLGGRDALKAAIKRAKDRGLRVILYSNGVIMDVATPFYREHGKDAANIMADGRVNLSQINKFTDGTPVVYATACPSSPTWRKQMLTLAVQAHELGADGLLYDQIGVYGRHECHHPEHNHANPMDGYATGRVEMIREIVSHMKAIDEDFVIATESFIAPMARELHMIHGFGYGYGLTHFSSGAELFPDLLRLTFPEVVSTNRIPQPLMDRNVAHYALMHGFRQELEIRYLDDVKLSRGLSLDWEDAYPNAAGSPPKKQMLLEAIEADEKNEMAKLRAFAQRHSDVFYHGKYQSDIGFTLKSDTVQARAYTTQNGALAVVLMNPDKQVASFELSVAEAQCTLVDTPDGSLAGAVQSLEPLSLCLMKFTKTP
ncbi:MAG: DUF6259 domain-containing protein [Phycisphaeraceae bacterium JB051]